MPPDEISVSVVPPVYDPTPEQIEELTEETRTLADDILEEVRECRTQQQQVVTDLENLRADGREKTQQFQELLTELKNLREENRNLQQELKALLESSRLQQPPQQPQSGPQSDQSGIQDQSTPSTSETTVIASLESVNPEGQTSQKKRRKVI